MSLEQKTKQLELELGLPKPSSKEKIIEFAKKHFDKENSYGYGDWHQRISFLTTDFHKIQTSMVLRMGIIYPYVSNMVEAIGLAPDTNFGPINFHAWAAGYIAYLIDNQPGISKHVMEAIPRLVNKARGLEDKVEQLELDLPKQPIKERLKYFAKRHVSSARKFYGNWFERSSINIMDFPKIQASILIRMGILYPIASYLTEQVGIPKDAAKKVMGMNLNGHAWLAGYASYAAEFASGASKYTLETIDKIGRKLRTHLDRKKQYAVAGVEAMM